MIVNPHGLYIKWQVLLINLYCHIIAVYVRGVVSLCSEHALRRWGLSMGEMKGGQTGPDVHVFYGLCPSPQLVVSLKAVNQQQRMYRRALSASLASG